MITPAPQSVSRRAFLGGALGMAAAVSGCGRLSAPQPLPPQLPIDVASLLAKPTFHIAHRGGGGNWPEMTAHAYAQTSQVPGIEAMEVSVCRSADGVLVASHDHTTTRTTGVAYTIAEQPWSTLSALRVSSAHTTDPRQAAQPLARFDEIAEMYLGRFVLFVEAKHSSAVDPLLKRLSALGQPQRVVWKASINSRTFAEAKQLGFSTWGYVFNEPAHVGVNLERLAVSSEIDMLGAPRAESDAFIAKIANTARHHGKITISWTIRHLQDERRVVGLGCRGLMTSHPLEVMTTAR